MIKKRLIYMLCGILLFISATGCDLSELAGGEKEEKVVYTTIEEVVDKINEEIAGETDGVITMYISEDIDQDDLKAVNMSLDTTKGSVKSMTTYTNAAGISDSIKLELKYEKSDSMYVYDNLVNGKSIPTDRTDAIVLATYCKQFLSTNIKDTMSDYEKELAIHDYIVNNCTYGFSTNRDDTEFTAYGAIVKRKAVCSGYAAAMHLLLMCSDVESQIISGKADSIEKSSETENHAWLLIKLDGNWYHVDPTWDDPIGSTEILTHEFFNVSDDIIDDTHEWDRSKYEKCNSMTQNYYQKNDVYFFDMISLENYLNVKLSTEKTDELEMAVGNFDVNDETLQFLFGIDGVNSVSYSVNGEGDYRILRIFINP